MKIDIVASGSKGNCALITTEEAKIIIDMGISYKQLKSRLNIDKVNVDAVLLTHEHSDHVSGLPTLLGNCDPTIFLTKGTQEGFHSSIYDGTFGKKKVFIKYNESFTIKDVRICPFQAVHDGLEPTGYILYYKDKKIVLSGDTGVFLTEEEDKIRNADIYLFESNYDPILLNKSDRPFFLKQRIMGKNGHLSNNECAYTLTKVLGDKTKQIVLLHLSQECNNEELALMTFKEVFEENGVTQDISIICAKQNEVIECKLK